MGDLKLLARHPLFQYCNKQMIVIQVLRGETKEQAWRRHLATHPEDNHTPTKIFNLPSASQ